VETKLLGREKEDAKKKYTNPLADVHNWMTANAMVLITIDYQKITNDSEVDGWYVHFISSFYSFILSYWNVICIVILMFLHILDDLWDFLTKSLFVAFNFWEPENSLFPCFWCFRTFQIPNEPGKNAQSLFF
jgi:hypothetical protein